MKQSSRTHIKNRERQCSTEVYADRAKPQHSINAKKMDMACQRHLGHSGLFIQGWKL